MLTLNKVNKALKEIGAEEILVRGEGYLYFTEGESHLWPETIVRGAFLLNSMSLKQWIDSYFELRNLYLS